METTNKIVVTETIPDQAEGSIAKPKFDGFFIQKYREKLLEEEQPETVDHILSNAFQSIGYFKDPNKDEQIQNPQKILCLGKVQSGKTSFFLGSIALAFDNGYGVAYVLGGTKLKLKKQNLGRIENSFNNNERVKIFDVTNGFNENLSELIKDGYKIILVILKNIAENTNLGKLAEFSQTYGEIPAVIVDDEGDEYTPGAEKAKKKNSKAGRTHDKIVDIITSFKTCTFLSVTATPQANFLVSTYDGISPNRLVLVKPGKGYTGGHEFFDTLDNKHVVEIEDKDDFIDSIPTSFKEALYFFIFACALKRCGGDLKPYSMLVHPSSFNAIQDIVASRIKNFVDLTIKLSTIYQNTIAYDDLCSNIEESYNTYLSDNGVCNYSLDLILKQLPDVISNIDIQTINHTNPDYGSEDDTPLYKIKVGGNMLGRGLTIDRLIVSYIYRDSKEAQVDTMYQRCRWFGYKQKYFDVCKVYMTKELRLKFMAIVSNEDHMWNALNAFLKTNINIKKFKRVFLLENDKLVLTRRTVSGTVVLKVAASGNKPDECISLNADEKEANRNLYIEFSKKHEKEGTLVDFDTSKDHRQRHLLVQMPFTTFFDEFLSKLNYAFGSPYSAQLFQLMVDKINKNELEDNTLIMFMRYGKGEHRSSDSGITVSRLFQGRNDGTSFTGDRYPKDINGNDYTNIHFFQIHMVDLYHDDPWLSTSIPLIAYNNPYTAKTIMMVTGDNIYED